MICLGETLLIIERAKVSFPFDVFHRHNYTPIIDVIISIESIATTTKKKDPESVFEREQTEDDGEEKYKIWGT